MARKAAPRKALAPPSPPVSKRTGKPLSAAYAARVARAEAQGKTRQQARGHIEKEHIRRRQRERAKADMLGGLTSSDREFARRYGASIKLQLKMGTREAGEAAVRKMQRMGADPFRAYARRMRAERASYERQRKAGSYASKGAGYMEAIMDEYGDGDEPEEMMWYFYH